MNRSQNDPARRQISNSLLARPSVLIVFISPPSLIYSKMFGCRAIKNASLASCSDIYTRNVHTWAAPNITWHYASSYENVQNGEDVLKKLFLPFFMVFFFFLLFFKARPKKNTTKETIPLEVLMYAIFLEWRSFFFFFLEDAICRISYCAKPKGSNHDVCRSDRLPAPAGKG